MPLTSQALTTMANMRLYLNLYTLTAVTASETLTATSTAYTTFEFAHSDLAPNYLGVFYNGTTADTTILTAGITVDYSSGSISVTAAITAGVTISGYSYFAWDYSKDSMLERNINSASGMVSKYCNRRFIADTYDEFYKGSGRQKLVLNQYPVNSIASIEVNSAALTAGTDYATSDSTYLDQGIVFKDNGWTWCGYITGLVGEPTAPIDNIEVTYSAGYTLTPETLRTLPYDIEDAVISIASDLYGQQQDGTVGLKQLTQGKLTYVWSENSLIDQHASVLNAYKKAVF